MNVTLNRVDEDFHFEGTGISNVKIDIDGSAEIGGKNAGARPMELILMGLGSCAAMDIVSMIKKQKQKLIDLIINIEGIRDSENIPAIFTDIKIEFLLYGNLNSAKVERIVKLSMEKYCSVSAMLSKTALINYSYKIIKTN